MAVRTSVRRPVAHAHRRLFFLGVGKNGAVGFVDEVINADVAHFGQHLAIPDVAHAQAQGRRQHARARGPARGQRAVSTRSAHGQRTVSTRVWFARAHGCGGIGAVRDTAAAWPRTDANGRPAHMAPPYTYEQGHVAPHKLAHGHGAVGGTQSTAWATRWCGRVQGNARVRACAVRRTLWRGARH